jgi:hypothetical protein
VERSDGAYAYLPAHAATDSLLFVLGDGWSHWINPVLKLSLRAAPHTIIVPPRAAADGVGKAVGGAGELTKLRLWHGRMVLPPATAPMPSGGDFESWRRGRVAWALEVAAGARDAATAGRNLERELDPFVTAREVPEPGSFSSYMYSAGVGGDFDDDDPRWRRKRRARSVRLRA